MGRKQARNITSTVWHVLLKYPKTRSSDRELITAIYRMYGVTNLPFGEVMHMEGLPSFESIGRARRKIQEEFPDMRGTTESEKARMDEQEDYLEFAREGVRGCLTR